MKKRYLNLALALAMLCALSPPVSAKTLIQLGNYVQMGTYYGEPILWRVVAFEKIVGYDAGGEPIIDSTDTVTEYQDGYLPLLLSDKIICLKAFDADTSINSISGSHSRRGSYESNYWADSNIRSWLNSNESAGNVTWLCGNPPTNDSLWCNFNEYDQEAGFLTNFTPDEINLVKSVTQKSIAPYPEYVNGIYDSGSEAYTYDSNISNIVQNYTEAYSEQVTDKFFLLDVQQINTVYNNGDVLGSIYYIGEPTDQCRENSEYKEPDISSGQKWSEWLRSPNTDSDYDCFTLCVDSSGAVRNTARAHSGGLGVRPAFFLSENVDFDGHGMRNDPYRLIEETNSNTVGLIGDDDSLSESNDLDQSGNVALTFALILIIILLAALAILIVKYKSKNKNSYNAGNSNAQNFCSECGAPLDGGSFCKKCGKHIESKY